MLEETLPPKKKRNKKYDKKSSNGQGSVYELANGT